MLETLVPSIIINETSALSTLYSESTISKCNLVVNRVPSRVTNLTYSMNTARREATSLIQTIVIFQLRAVAAASRVDVTNTRCG